MALLFFTSQEGFIQLKASAEKAGYEEREEKRMKHKIVGVFFLSLMAVLWLQTEKVGAESIDRWNLTKEYTMEQDSVRYHAYLTKDKQESWIYEAELLDKTKMLDVTVPKTIEGAPVVCLGYTREWYRIDESHEVDWLQNLFGLVNDYWNTEHSGRGILTIKSVVLPDSIREIGPYALACLYNVQYIHLPSNLTELTDGTFYGCENIVKIDFPSKVKIGDIDVFLFCDKLAGLKHETRNLKGNTLIFSGNMVINQTEKTLIQVMPDAKKITIPADVKWIEPTAFKNCSLKTVKVAKKNKSFAVHKRCLYRKKEKQLVLVFGKGSTVTLSKKIKEIGEDVATAKYKIKKLVIPKKIKRFDNWKKPFKANNKKVKIYYCGKRIR